MKYRIVAVFIAIAFLQTGCATIIKGSNTSLALSTVPEEGAACVLTNPEGTWHITTPGSITVPRTKRDLIVTCTKDGYDDKRIVISAESNDITAGNIIAGGIIGFGVDAATGANFGYPEKTEIVLRLKDPPPPPAPPPAPPMPDAAPGAAPDATMPAPDADMPAAMPPST